MSEAFPYPFEPFKIKTTERISVTTRSQREKILKEDGSQVPRARSARLQ